MHFKLCSHNLLLYFRLVLNMFIDIQTSKKLIQILEAYQLYIITGSNTKFLWLSVWYGIKCCLGVITHKCTLLSPKGCTRPYHMVSHLKKAFNSFLPQAILSKVCSEQHHFSPKVARARHFTQWCDMALSTYVVRTHARICCEEWGEIRTKQFCK